LGFFAVGWAEQREAQQNVQAMRWASYLSPTYRHETQQRLPPVLGFAALNPTYGR